MAGKFKQVIYAGQELVDGSGGGGGDITVEALNCTENKTYTAPEGKAYSPVTVNVSGGEHIVAITPMTVTYLFEEPEHAAAIYSNLPKYENGQYIQYDAITDISATVIDTGYIIPYITWPDSDDYGTLSWFFEANVMSDDQSYAFNYAYSNLVNCRLITAEHDGTTVVIGVDVIDTSLPCSVTVTCTYFPVFPLP